MLTYRICTTNEPCGMRDGKRCLLESGSCKSQGATVTIHETKEQAFKDLLKKLE